MAASHIFSSDHFTFTAFRDSLYRRFRHWGAELLSSFLYNCMIFLNPKLTSSQQSQLLLITSRVMETFLHTGSLDDHLMRSLVTLASPDHGTSLLLNYLLEAFASSLSIPTSSSAPLPREDVDVSTTLIKQYGLDQVAVSAMPPAVRRAVLKTLADATSPVCCITLEPLLWPDCTVSADVVAVVLKEERREGVYHAFLYRGKALYEWLGRRQVPVSPETRSVVKPSDVYRLS